MSNIQNLDTPVAMIDRAIMKKNIQRMQQHMDKLGVAFRPHIKTTKCLGVVNDQIEAGAKGITVATLQEAELFFNEGITDILYAVGIAPKKLDKALELRRRGCNLKIVTDSIESATFIANFGKDKGESFDVLIEIDSDGHRCGVNADSPHLTEIAEILQSAGMNLAGVMTHAGSSYDFDSAIALEKLAEQERSVIVHAADLLRKSGYPCPIVSVGSTPTALYAKNLDGVTELRAGTYVLFDLFMRNVGVCDVQDIAVSVLTTVIAHQLEKGWIIVDAGWMAMSRDRGTQRQKIDYGYGQVCTVDGSELHGYLLSITNQDHGIITGHNVTCDEILTNFPIGTQLRILPNHSCATGAQYCEYHVIDGDNNLKVWPRMQGMPKI